MRTPLTYYGGKQRLADVLVALMPAHRLYLEPFAGGLAVLFRKTRAERETINDVDGAVVAFWRALRDQPRELAAAVASTPYSREEWETCFAALDDEVAGDVERARRLLVSIDQSYARCGDTWSPPSKLGDRPGRWQPATWHDMPERLLAAVDRLQDVAVERASAIDLIPKWDVPGALIYCDPPYTGEHRLRGTGSYKGGKRGYRHDVTPELWPDLAHEAAGWEPVPLQTRRHSGNRRGAAGQRAPETVWLSPACADAQRPLTFAMEAGA